MIQAETVTELTRYLEYWSSGIYMFKCPGCKYLHPFHVKDGAHHNGSTWDFNGDIDKPTFKRFDIELSTGKHIGFNV